jgi:hypothetical protein
MSVSDKFSSKITVYLGGELLINENGNPSFCDVLTVDDKTSLAIDERITITSLLYLVYYCSPEPPDTSLDFEISEDGGITKEKVNYIRHIPDNGFHEILLQGC